MVSAWLWMLGFTASRFTASLFTVSLFTVSLFTVSLFTASLFAAGEPASPSAGMLGDAELHDIYFLDQDRGWAVGDHGVIWQTENGGRHWRLRDSPTTARLRSICFVNQQLGWIVGGWTHPYTRRSSAVLLRTDDSGKKWTRVDLLTVPALRQVFFADAHRGCAIGDVSSLTATGLFHTTDGGYTWESPPLKPALPFLSGAFLDARRGLLLAADGSSWSMSDGRLAGTGRILDDGSRALAVRFSPGLGWLVGEHGAVRLSQDHGVSWGAVPGKLPDDAVGEFTWRAVAAHGDRCWIAGTPGSGILHSPDGGRSWRLSRSGQSLPINQLFFFDERHGWAAGPLGRILATRDGGQTWRTQRSGGERLALLALPSSAEQLSLELLAKAAAEDGRFAAVTALFGSEENPIERGLAEERLRDACGSVGAVTAQILPQIRFASAPNRKSGHAVGSDSTGGALALSHGEPVDSDLLLQRRREVVRQLRMWRPDVVLTDNLPTKEHDSRRQLTVQAVLSAVQQAADPAVFPDQIVLAGLEPWSVRKVFGVVRPPEHAGVSVDVNRLSMALGSSLADYSSAGRGLLSEALAEPPPIAGCRLLWSQAAQEIAARDLFGGVPPASVGETRRLISTPPAGQLADLSRSAQHLRELQQIVERGIGDEGSLATVLPQIEQLVQGQQPVVAGRMLHRLAQRLIAAGQYPPAAECLTALVDRFPDHPLSDAAWCWLVRYYGSVEIQWAFGPRKLVRLPAISSAVAAASSLFDVTPGTRLNNPVQNAVLLVPSADPSQTVTNESLSPLVRFTERFRQTRPGLFADPRIQFPLVADARRSGRTQEAGRLLNILARSQLSPAWRSVAATEQRLLENLTGAPPAQASAFEPDGNRGTSVLLSRIRGLNRPIVTSFPTNRRPRLDGHLEDACWHDANRLHIPATESMPPTEVQFSHDDEFLYFAIRSTAAPGDRIERTDEPRTRDASLAAYDRVELELDLDRDYQTCYELTVDERGWTNDSCAGDRSWNPKWFVAAGLQESGAGAVAWTAETAIPISEFMMATEAAGSVWCIRLRRTAPHRTAQCWPTTTDLTFGGKEFALLHLAPGR